MNINVGHPCCLMGMEIDPHQEDVSIRLNPKWVLPWQHIDSSSWFHGRRQGYAPVCHEIPMFWEQKQIHIQMYNGIAC